MEKTLVLIKPDGVQRGLIGTIMARLEGTGLRIAGMKMIKMDRPLAEKHYGIHKGKAFFVDLVNYITSGPLVAAVFEGPQAVNIVRKKMGATDPAKAESGTIRGDYSVEISYNLVHGSDSVENAEKEIALFFSPQEILSYKRDIDRWITES